LHKNKERIHEIFNNLNMKNYMIALFPL